MREINQGDNRGYGTNTTLCIGMVKNNADPAQHGRLQIWIPSIDSDTYEIEDLPWALYVSPYGGTTVDFITGRDGDKVPGASSYGMWAIPKNGAQVLVGFLEGDPNVRFWMGCFYMPELNRTLPSAINTPQGQATEIDETGSYPQKPIPHMINNLKEAGLSINTKHYKTRGGFERSVSHPSNKNTNKPRDDGYATNPQETEKADSQAVSWTSPGRHFFVMSDVADHSRIRIKTSEGNQIILDDTNERIYVSTAKGRNFIELDETSGKIYIYSSSKLNLHSDNDINISSNENINIRAKKRLNLISEERGVKIQAKMNIQQIATGGDLKLTASRSIHLKTTNGGNSKGVGASQSCSGGPFKNKGLGVVREFSEPAGSGASGVFINAAQSINIKADNGSVSVAGKSLNFRASSGNLNLQASSTLNLNGGTIATRGSGVLGMITGTTLRLNVYSRQNASGAAVAAGAAAATAENIKSKMVVPQHEPWDRDEDEKQCKTPRNKNYQG